MALEFTLCFYCKFLQMQIAWKKRSYRCWIMMFRNENFLKKNIKIRASYVLVRFFRQLHLLKYLARPPPFKFCCWSLILADSLAESGKNALFGVCLKSKSPVKLPFHEESISFAAIVAYRCNSKESKLEFSFGYQSRGAWRVRFIK